MNLGRLKSEWRYDRCETPSRILVKDKDKDADLGQKGESIRRPPDGEALLHVRHTLGGKLLAVIGVALLLPPSARAQDVPCDMDTDPTCPTPLSRIGGVLKDYVTAPLHWSGTDWWFVGGTAAAIGIAHGLDGSVRKHFVGNSSAALVNPNTHELQDALPAAALFVGTWGYAHLIDDSNGKREAGAMIESSILSVGTAYILQFAAGRQRPDQTTDPNRWRAGGSSFPSVHTTAAFAIGSVLAESGNDEYRWIRRLLGYGAAGFTLYERLDHNAHWLSDTVAGAALGTATAHFVMNRDRLAASQDAAIGLAPMYDGVMLTYTVHFH